MTSSTSSPSTGNRECPVSAATAITSAAVASRSKVTAFTRGVMTSAAVWVEKVRVRWRIVASSRSSRPSVAERRMRKLNSSALRAPESSSFGSMPIARMTRFAVPLKNTMIGLNTKVNPIWNGTTNFAVASGTASAKFLGTSSPRIIENRVARATPMTAPIALTADSATPRPRSGSRRSELMAGSNV